MTLEHTIYCWLALCAIGGFCKVPLRQDWIALGMILACAILPPGCAPLPGPTVPDSAIDGGCALDDKITAARVIANPDGTPLVIHCDAGAP